VTVARCLLSRRLVQFAQDTKKTTSLEDKYIFKLQDFHMTVEDDYSTVIRHLSENN